MKTNRHTLVAVIVAAAALVLFNGPGGVSAGEDPHSAQSAGPAGSTSGMLNFYVGSGVRVGNFPGKLVCLRCDLKPGPEAMKLCEKEGHRHALAMDDSMIHPLLAMTSAVQNQINSGDLHAKEVVVHGKFYPASGVIAVDRVAERKGAAAP